MNIRPAHPMDLPFLLDVAEAFFEYHPGKITFNSSHMYDLLSKIMDKGIILIAEEDGVSAGAIGAIVDVNPFDPSIRVMTELFWWVVPEYRKGAVGRRLLDRLERDCTKDNLADRIVLSSTVKTPQLEAVYARRGYVPVEYAYIKEIK